MIINAALEALREQRDARIAYLEEQFRMAQQKQFSKSTEGHLGHSRAGYHFKLN